MGLDVHTICQHTLDTSSLAALAEDLSGRLQINVNYGFNNIDGLSELTGHKGYNFITLGSVINSEQASTYD